MASKPPARHPWGRYTDAEDLCDPCEARESLRENPPRPRRHAVNLAEALEADGGMPPRRAAAPVKAPPHSVAMTKPTPSEPSFEPAPFAIRAVNPSSEGETVAVELGVPADFAAWATNADRANSGPPNGLYTKPTPATPRQDPGHASVAPTARLKLYLLIEQYVDLRPQPGEITRETAEALVAAGRLCAAVRRGMRLLGYGDRSARRLAYQLTAKGIDRATAEAASAYLVEKGLIQEDNAACLRAEAGLRKLWGLRRIRDDLRAGGYTPEAIEEAMATLSDVDFEENCRSLIRRKYRGELSSGTLAADRTARQRLTASLMRLGYDGDVIRASLRAVLEEP